MLEVKGRVRIRIPQLDHVPDVTVNPGFICVSAGWCALFSAVTCADVTDVSPGYLRSVKNQINTPVTHYALWSEPLAAILWPPFISSPEAQTRTHTLTVSIQSDSVALIHIHFLKCNRNFKPIFKKWAELLAPREGSKSARCVNRFMSPQLDCTND